MANLRDTMWGEGRQVGVGTIHEERSLISTVASSWNFCGLTCSLNPSVRKRARDFQSNLSPKLEKTLQALTPQALAGLAMFGSSTCRHQSTGRQKLRAVAARLLFLLSGRRLGGLGRGPPASVVGTGARPGASEKISLDSRGG